MPEPVFLDSDVAVCGQLKPDDLPDVAKRGFRTIVNNRPEREAWFGQPTAATLDEAAATASLQSHHIAFTMPTLKAEDARKLQTVVDGAGGPVLVFCASGFRSALLWAIMRAAAGVPLNDLLKASAAAGQPLENHRETIERLSGELRGG